MTTTSSVSWISNDSDAVRYGAWYSDPETEELACARCGSTEDVSAAGLGDGIPLCVDCLELGAETLWDGYYDEVYG